MEINLTGNIDNFSPPSPIKTIAIDEYSVIFTDGNIESIILRIGDKESYLLVSLRSGQKYSLNNEYSKIFINQFNLDLFFEATELYTFAINQFPFKD